MSITISLYVLCCHDYPCTSVYSIVVVVVMVTVDDVTVGGEAYNMESSREWWC